MKRLLSFIGVVAVTAILDYERPVEALCVIEKEANLRQGPGPEWKKTWEAIRYMPLKKLGKKDGWYRVEDLDGVIHWIREDIVTTKYSCAAIKTEFSNLRMGPGTHWPLHKAERGEKYLSFRVLESRGQWLRLEDSEGDRLWATRDNLWIQ